MSLLTPRYRAILSDYFILIVTALVVVALASGFVAGATLTDDTTREHQQTDGSWTVETDFEHGATVERDAAVFEEGDRLEDRTLYFTRLTPELDGAYVVHHDGTDGEPAVVDADLVLVRRAIDDRGGGAEVHWRETETLASIEGTELPDEEPLRLPFTVDVTEQQQRIAEIQEAIGASPGTTEVLLVAELTIEGSAGGDQFTETRTERLELQPGGRTYSVVTNSEGATEFESTETVAVSSGTDPLRAYGSILLVVVAVAGVVGLGVARHTEHLRVSPEERERMRFERNRSEFDEWISHGHVPEIDRPTVHVDSLEDIVDVAIDSDRRVIESADAYYVLLDDTRYVYDPKSDSGADLGTGKDRPSGTPSEADAFTEDDSIGTDSGARREEKSAIRPSGGDGDRDGDDERDEGASEATPFDMSTIESGEE